MRTLLRVAGCLVALGVALPVAAAGAAEPTKVTIGPQVGLLGAAAGSVWAPDQTSRARADRRRDREDRWPASRPAPGRSRRSPPPAASGSRTSTAARSRGSTRARTASWRASRSAPAVRPRRRRRQRLGVELGRGHRLAHRPAHEPRRRELRRGHRAERAAARLRRAVGRRLRRRQAAEARPGERPHHGTLADRARRLDHRLAGRAVGLERAGHDRPHRPGDAAP